jgi:hypothetical protein
VEKLIGGSVKKQPGIDAPFRLLGSIAVVGVLGSVVFFAVGQIVPALMVVGAAVVVEFMILGSVLAVNATRMTGKRSTRAGNQADVVPQVPADPLRWAPHS